MKRLRIKPKLEIGNGKEILLIFLKLDLFIVTVLISVFTILALNKFEIVDFLLTWHVQLIWIIFTSLIVFEFIVYYSFLFPKGIKQINRRIMIINIFLIIHVLAIPTGNYVVFELLRDIKYNWDSKAINDFNLIKNAIIKHNDRFGKYPETFNKIYNSVNLESELSITNPNELLVKNENDYFTFRHPGFDKRMFTDDDFIYGVFKKVVPKELFNEFEKKFIPIFKKQLIQFDVKFHRLSINDKEFYDKIKLQKIESKLGNYSFSLTSDSTYNLKFQGDDKKLNTYDDWEFHLTLIQK